MHGYQSIHVFLINYVDLFRNLNFLDFFPFLDLILIDLNMVLLRAWKMIWSLWKFGLINIILRKLLIKILVSVQNSAGDGLIFYVASRHVFSRTGHKHTSAVKPFLVGTVWKIQAIVQNPSQVVKFGGRWFGLLCYL